MLGKQTSGPLAGFALLGIDWARFEQYENATVDKGIRYGFGSKDPHLGAWPVDYTSIDCSGYVRAILAYATHQQTTQNGMPDGSFLEADWFKAQGFKAIDYSTAPDWASHLIVGIHRPGGRGGDAVGHIWLCIHGHTIESYGGHGPGTHAWDDPWYPDHCDECYVLATGPGE